MRFFSLVLCLVTAVSARAQGWDGLAPCRNTNAQIAALLPPAQKAFGVNVEVVGAGTSEHTLVKASPTASMIYGMSGGFYFQVKSNEQVTQDGAGHLHVVSVVGEDGTVLPSCVEGLCFTNSWQSDEVNPKWAYLRANFEVAAPDTTETQRGVVRTPFHVAEVQIPVTGEQALNIVAKGSQGTQILLRQIYRNVETGLLYIRYHVEKRPQGVSAALSPHPTDATSPTTFSAYDEVNAFDEGQLEVEKVGREARTVTLDGDIIESSQNWRDESKFKQLSFQIPVAPVIRKLKFKTSFKNILIPEARIELERLGQFDERDHWLAGSFWLVPPAGRDVRFESVVTVPPNIRFWSLPTEEFWRGDGTPAPVNGVFIDAQNPAPTMVDTFRLSCDIVSRPVVRSHPVFRNIPLPHLGQAREFKTGKYQSGGLCLRKVGWIEESQDFPREFAFTPTHTPSLVWVFERQKTSTEFAARIVGAFDNRGVAYGPPTSSYFRLAQAFFSQKDVLGGSPLKGNLLVIYCPFYNEKSKTMNLSLDWRDFGESKRTPIEIALPVEKFKGPLEFPIS